MILFEGAWVLCGNGGWLARLCRVEGFDAGKVLAGGTWHPRSSVGGVPVECNILECSGWSREETAGVVSYTSPDGRMRLRKGDSMNSGMEWILHIDSPDMDTLANAEVECVSQIQFLAEMYGVEFSPSFPSRMTEFGITRNGAMEKKGCNSLMKF